MKDTVITIIDDDESVRGSLQMLLQSMGWPASVYDSAEQFLAELPAAGVPDCLLLDLNMGGMNGADLIEELALRQPQLPVVIMTACSDSSLALRARKAGAQDILGKPFNVGVLQDSIERALVCGARRKLRSVGIACSPA
jgi:FixJ family two-component response regulator